MKNLQVLQLDKYVFYGDSAYFADECIRSKHRGDNRTERQMLEDDSMSKCRQSTEWDYGQVGQLVWKTVIYKKGLQLRKQPVCSVVTLAFLLTNAYNCMNANITAEYYSCIPPTLEEWTAQGPRETIILSNFEWEHNSIALLQ